MTEDETRMIDAARAAFADAQKRAGTADIVARVRKMPDGTLDVIWERRASMQAKLRYGSVGGTHPALARVAGGLHRAAAKGSFFVVAITAADDSDATLVTASRAASPAAAVT